MNGTALKLYEELLRLTNKRYNFFFLQLSTYLKPYLESHWVMESL